MVILIFARALLLTQTHSWSNFRYSTPNNSRTKCYARSASIEELLRAPTRYLELNVKVATKITTTTANGDFSLLTKTPTKKEEVLISIPSPQTLSFVDDGNTAERKGKPTMLWFSQLSIDLHNLKQDPSPFFKTWLDSLPKTFSTPIHFDDKILETCTYRPIAEAVSNQKSEYRLQFNAIDHSKLKSPLSYDDFVWGVEIARSRAFSSKFVAPFDLKPFVFVCVFVAVYVGFGLGTIEQAANGCAFVLCGNILNTFVAPSKLRYVIAPIVDLCNHSNNPTCDVAFEFFSDSFSLTANSEMSSNSPVDISYGERTNDQLFLNYGFVIEDNDFDTYILPALKDADIAALESKIGNEICADRLLKLSEANLLAGNIVLSKENPKSFDPAVIQALRVLVSSDEEFESANKAIGGFFQFQVSEANEAKVNLCCKELLRAEVEAFRSGRGGDGNSLLRAFLAEKQKLLDHFVSKFI